ncbi:MAG TPA: hypothetical protein VLU25_16020 [Acidobacteriota bacterium]|nr:hypothetical protein [Acidobacteriota bacterium]
MRLKRLQIFFRFFPAGSLKIHAGSQKKIDLTGTYESQPGRERASDATAGHFPLLREALGEERPKSVPICDLRKSAFVLFERF